MDFFAQQEDARRRTGLLLFFYGAAVVLIMAAIYAVVIAVFGVLDDHAEAMPLWDPLLLFWVIVGTLAIIGGGTAYKVAQLKRGGRAVAEMLGGRPVSPDTTDPNERKLMNVVEEMALASGTAIPAVYVLDHEPAINAFAAGFSVNDAVVAVTRGTMEQLSRDELQGVMAHEFSHILNGDMRLNIKLTGILHGILVIALLGYTLMRSLQFSGGSRRSSKGGGGIIAIFFLGVSLWIIGYIGVFFANLIKSAVSRQREFLADASAVQFTRNPGGIGGALQKIADLTSGSRLQNAHAAEAGHFFFANGLRSGMTGLLATHPPVKERIRRIGQQPLGTAQAKPVEPPPLPQTGQAGDAEEDRLIGGAVLLGMAGQVDAAQLTRSQRILDTIPPVLRDAAHQHLTARALVFGLLLSKDDTVREKQLDGLSANTQPDIYADLLKWLPDLDHLDPAARLPLAALAVTGLRTMPKDDYQRFHANFEQTIQADGQVSLFEYAMMRMIHRHVAVAYERHPEIPVRHTRWEQVADDVTALLSSIARWDRDEDDATRAYQAAVSDLPAMGQLLAEADCGLNTIDRALDALAQASPALKRPILDACARCVAADQVLHPEEAELLRAIADALDCPVPPVPLNDT